MNNEELVWAIKEIVAKGGQIRLLNEQFAKRDEPLSLIGLDLTKANFSGCKMPSVSFFECPVRHANFRYAKMHNTIFGHCDMSHVELGHAEFVGTLFREVYIRDASGMSVNFQKARFEHGCIKDSVLNYARLDHTRALSLTIASTDIKWSCMSHAVFENCTFRSLDLSGSDLRSADLTNTHIAGCNLSKVNLSGTLGLLDPMEWMDDNFTAVVDGYIVYKSFGSYFEAPDQWKERPGAIITEVPNPDRSTDCGSGVNFATLGWIRNDLRSRNGRIWKCLLPWKALASVVVPFQTDGKARCGHLMLLEEVADEHHER